MFDVVLKNKNKIKISIQRFKWEAGFWYGGDGPEKCDDHTLKQPHLRPRGPFVGLFVTFLKKDDAFTHCSTTLLSILVNNSNLYLNN